MIRMSISALNVQVVQCSLPFIAVTVADGMEAIIEEPVLGGERCNCVLAVIVVTAASVGHHVRAQVTEALGHAATAAPVGAREKHVALPSLVNCNC